MDKEQGGDEVKVMNTVQNQGTHSKIQSIYNDHKAMPGEKSEMKQYKLPQFT